MASSTAEDTDYEILQPPADLRKKVRIMNRREAAKFDPVKAAEAALDRLSQNFGSWMDNETKALMAAWATVQADGVTADNLATLYQAVHNIKGQAETLGYPLVGQVAAGFCHLIDNIGQPERLPVTLAGRYVHAIRAMVSEDARDTGNATGVALLETLLKVSDDYIEGLTASECA